MPMSIFFHGKVTPDFFITGVVCSFFVSMINSYFMVNLIKHEQESEERYHRLFEVESDAILMVDCETDRILDANAAALKLYGYTPEEFLRLQAVDVSAEPDKTRQAISTHQVQIPFRRHCKKDGTVFPVEIASSYFDYQGRKVHVAAIRDITERRKAEETLLENEAKTREAKEHFEFIFDTSPDAILISQLHDGLFIDMNKGFTTFTGFTRDNIIGKKRIEVNLWKYPADLQKVIDELSERGFCENVEAHFRRKDSTEITGLLSAKVFTLQGKQHIISFTRDITERKKMEDELRSLSLTDELTGLYNRRGFVTATEKLEKLAKRQKKGLFMLYVDLNEMKTINDTWGHKEGDLALIEMANILSATYRESDVIARIGGDEFVVVPVGTTGDDTRIIIDRLQKNIDAHNANRKKGYKLSVSWGLSYYDPENPSSIDELVSHADKLMYEQKKNTRKPAADISGDALKYL